MRSSSFTAGSLVLVLALLAGLTQAGCGFDLDLSGLWDDTCYDCRTVCQGTLDEELNDCLAACSQCQGSSECFTLLDGRFVGMQNSLPDWTAVDCARLD
ncbi:MAG TPA: hypothetical protein PK668_01275 [Myxococcota bacterium]|nr:hypothetical protein [Myxococcota bacterium]HRY96733.1 hypothetical protein [Myxococcota bacterium]HSA22407.1 hypothetical protein [Myxococcota bacterium]